MNILSNKTYQNIGQHRVYTSNNVSNEFQSKVISAIDEMNTYSQKTSAAIGKLENIIILKDKDSQIPDEYAKTNKKFKSCASDAYGFVSRADNAIVLVEDNHKRKNAALEGDIASQAQDTLTHETGHLIDNELSTTDIFKSAYLEDLSNIAESLKDDTSTIQGERLQEMVEYLHHYMEGVNFEDGIDDSDISREGLRENFAECFSTLVDLNPTKINKIYAELFPNTMKVTREFVI